ncbi:hypothetical protein AURDEDRAFT_166215 [Auricularia subglabra TFB-10046 SS5]|nr:hypothetical protein AURDEDRAFT_166215 [Auricularia subglabra TFB-10046 SS5]
MSVIPLILRLLDRVNTQVGAISKARVLTVYMDDTCSNEELVLCALIGHLARLKVRASADVSGALENRLGFAGGLCASTLAFPSLESTEDVQAVVGTFVCGMPGALRSHAVLCDWRSASRTTYEALEEESAHDLHLEGQV